MDKLKVTYLFHENETEVEAIRTVLQPLIASYPQFNEWFDLKFIKGLRKGERAAITIYSHDEIVGIGLVKCTVDEAKICTFYISPAYAKQGIGTILMSQCLYVLDNKTPIISVPSTKVNDFEPLFRKFKFQRHKTYQNLYVDGVDEVAYNGALI